MEESCYSPTNCAMGGFLDTKPSLNLITHHYTPLCPFLLFRFHSMQVLVIWDYTPTAFLITFEINIISYSVQDNSLLSSTFIFLFCHTSRESYRTDVLSIEGNNFGMHSQLRKHKPHPPTPTNGKGIQGIQRTPACPKGVQGIKSRICVWKQIQGIQRI